MLVKIAYTMFNTVATLFLTLCIMLSVSAIPTVDSFVPPPGSPIAKELAGEKRIADMEGVAQAARNAPVTVSSSQGGKNGYELRAEAFNAAQQRIDTEKRMLNREVADDIQKIRQDTKKLDSETSEQWADRMMNKFNVFPHTGTRIVFADSSPCDISPEDKRSGCVTQNLNFFGYAKGENITLYLEPAAVGNIYVLFHEIGHTKGIMDECTADHYSRSITGLPGGFYC